MLADGMDGGGDQQRAVNGRTKTAGGEYVIVLPLLDSCGTADRPFGPEHGEASVLF